MKKNKLEIQCKAKDFKKSHAWICDIKNAVEIPMCEPLRETPYLMPARFAGIGKPCKKCLAKLAEFRIDYPDTPITYDFPKIKPVKPVV